MAKHLNRWKPDTCDCEILQHFDDALSPDEMVIQVEKVEYKCPAHAHMNDFELFDAVLDENQTKNVTLYEIQQQEPHLFDPNNLPKTDQLKWRYNESRDLEIETNLDQAKKRGLESKFNGPVFAVMARAMKRKVIFK